MNLQTFVQIRNCTKPLINSERAASGDLNNSILVAIGVDTQEMEKKNEEAMSLLMKDKFKEASSLFAELAINHHTQSQYILGLMYLKGDGV